MTTDERLHYIGGFLKALPARLARRSVKEAKVTEIDHYGFDREWSQNLAGENPNIPMSAHQMAEARAWGDGARDCLCVDPQRPAEYDLGYPIGYPWKT